jgi:hypothetical protein
MLVRDISTGERFGRWEVVAYSHKSEKGKHYWLCKCDCGSQKPVFKHGLLSGISRSCGCLRGDELSARQATHRMTKSKVHRAWINMKHRCSNEDCAAYPNYGGRGIVVCAEWAASFGAFLRDMGEPPTAKHSLDRIDNNRGYEPGNVVWATVKQQNNNKRTNKTIEFGGKSMTAAAWDQWLGFKPGLVSQRLKKGWPIERALNPKLKRILENKK